jgi:hypothetical protein
MTVSPAEIRATVKTMEDARLLQSQADNARWGVETGVEIASAVGAPVGGAAYGAVPISARYGFTHPASPAEDPFAIVAAGRSHFRAADLIDLAALVATPGATIRFTRSTILSSYNTCNSTTRRK